MAVMVSSQKAAASHAQLDFIHGFAPGLRDISLLNSYHFMGSAVQFFFRVFAKPLGVTAIVGRFHSGLVGRAFLRRFGRPP